MSFVLVLVLVLVFLDRVFLYSSGCPATHFVDQAGLRLRNPPASASQVLGLPACATTARLQLTFLYFLYFEMFHCILGVLNFLAQAILKLGSSLLRFYDSSDLS